MKLNRYVLWVTIAALLGCAEARVREGTPAAAEGVLELANQVASLQRYATQMEKTYAAQEAEILALRRAIATPEACRPAAATAQVALQRTF